MFIFGTMIAMVSRLYQIFQITDMKKSNIYKYDLVLKTQTPLYVHILDINCLGFEHYNEEYDIGVKGQCHIHYT